jgi:hypothetical protein
MTALYEMGFKTLWISEYDVKNQSAKRVDAMCARGELATLLPEFR